MTKRLARQILNFGIIGILSTVLDYFLFLLFVHVFIWNYLIASTISYTAGIAFNYWASMRYVFVSNQKYSRTGEFFLYFLLNFMGMALNQFFLWISVAFLNFLPSVGKIFATILVMIYNFISRKLVFDSSEAQRAD